MAVYTHVSEKNLEIFLELYNVGSLKWVKGIAEGVENSNYILATDKGQFILTLYEARVNVNDLPFFLGLMNHLAEAGLETARPIVQNNGSLFSDLCGKKAALIEFLDGVALKNTSEQNLFQLGVETAKFHQKADSFELRRENSVGLKAWKKIFEDSGDVDHVAPKLDGGLAKLMQDELDYLSANMPTNLPKGVVHADLFPDNVFFIDGNLSGIIDFYFACEDLFAYELAIIINAWCFDKDGINLGKIKALFRGYDSVRKLTSDELAAMPVLCRASAMRFLVTRLYDWINVPKDALVLPKRPDEYIEKLQFHQKIKHTSEYGL